VAVVGVVLGGWLVALSVSALAVPPPPDSDGDGFDDALEGSIGTDPADPCPGSTLFAGPAGHPPGDNAWPLDVDNNTAVTIVDIFATASRFGTTQSRYDMNGDGGVAVADIFQVAAAFGATCPPSFTHGVASGDATTSSAIVWTRTNIAAKIEVEVFTDGTLTTKVFEATVNTLAGDDFTAKVDAAGLASATVHYYRWRHDDADNASTFSPVGAFTTAPAANVAADVSFTYSGDSDGTVVGGARPFGAPFGAVLDQARLEGGDFFVYLGDTIYSDSGLRPSPATTLAEYRSAYKVNREVVALRNLLGATSVYAQPDDHEIQNDYDGLTVDPVRYANGRRAFLNYMPVRDTALLSDPSCAGDPLYRTFRWGSEVELFFLDERSCRSADVGGAADPCLGDLAPALPPDVRDDPPFNLFLVDADPGTPGSQPPAGCLNSIFDPSRTMLGPVQKQQFKSDLASSTARFKLVLSELAIQQFFAAPYDRWEGYGAERNEILNFIRSNGIGNVIFLTTDNHANLVNEVSVDVFADPSPIVTELVAGPIATSTLEDSIFGTLGQGGVDVFNLLLDVAQMDCRELDKYSYGVVEVDAAGSTATVTLKDDAGTTVVNRGSTPPAATPCVEVFGP